MPDSIGVPLTQETATKSDLVKVSMNFSPQTIAVLRDLSQKSGATMTEVARRGIGLQKFIAQEIEAGGKLLIEDSKGKMQRVILP